MTPQATETLKLQLGEVHVIALTQPYGKPVASRFGGDQLMFTLADGRKLFVDPYVQDRLKAANVAPGVPFEIEKRESVQGNRRVVSVEVRPLKAAGPGVQAAPAHANTGITTYAPQSTPPASTTEYRPSAPQRPQLPQMPVNGNGETAAAIMARCYKDAIDVALSAQAYARENGLMLAPVFEDVRAMGTALFIQNGARR